MCTASPLSPSPLSPSPLDTVCPLPCLPLRSPGYRVPWQGAADLLTPPRHTASQHRPNHPDATPTHQYDLKGIFNPDHSTRLLCVHLARSNDITSRQYQHVSSLSRMKTCGTSKHWLHCGLVRCEARSSCMFLSTCYIERS